MISYQNFQKPLLERDLTWSKNEFIYSIRENPEKTNIQQILAKNFKKDRCIRKSKHLLCIGRWISIPKR